MLFKDSSMLTPDACNLRKLALMSLLAASFTFNASADTFDTQLNQLPADQRAWVTRSCRRSLGPSLYKDCMSREIDALLSPWPDLSDLSQADLAWVQQSCPYSLGPNLYKDCITRDSEALRAQLPAMTDINDEDRAWIAQSCPKSLGPSLYLACVTRESNALRQ